MIPCEYVLMWVTVRYLCLSTFQCVADVSVWRVSACGVCQYVACVSVWRVSVSVSCVSVCGVCQYVACVVCHTH